MSAYLRYIPSLPTCLQHPAYLAYLHYPAYLPIYFTPLPTSSSLPCIFLTLPALPTLPYPAYLTFITQLTYTLPYLTLPALPDLTLPYLHYPSYLTLPYLHYLQYAATHIYHTCITQFTYLTWIYCISLLGLPTLYLSTPIYKDPDSGK